MITNKQRANLKGLANKLDAVMQIGKEGISENSLLQLNGLFDSRELFKIKVLPNCDFSAKEIAQQIAAKTDAEVVQVIGNKVVLYKLSTNEKTKHIEF
ncbi:MAG: YhbY family RNA-binding protein [Clostridia bacterium]